MTIALGQFDDVIGRGLVQVLREDHPSSQIIATNLDGAELMEVAACESPRVVALNGSAVVDAAILGRLRVVQPETAVVVLAHEPTRAFGMALLAAGATCVALSVTVLDILKAVHLAAQGGRVFVSSDGERVERHYPTRASSLTRREFGVLRHLSQGESYAEISLAMRIRPETVRRHTVNIRRKLHVVSREDLIGLPIPSTPDFLEDEQLTG